MKKLLTMMVAVLFGCPLFGALTDGLVAHYKFDGDWVDSSGNGNHLIPKDGMPPTLVTDRYGNANSACAFDGDKKQNLWLGEEVSDCVLSNSFTYSMWVKATASYTDYGAGWAVWNEGCYAIFPAHGDWFLPNGSGLGLKVGHDGIELVEHDTYYMPTVLSYQSTIGYGWNHVAVTIENNGAPLLYINGVKVAEGTATDKIKVAQPSLLGGNEYGYFTGMMDDVRVYSRALSAAEVKALYEGANSQATLLHRWSFNGNLTDSVGDCNARVFGRATTDGKSYILPGGESGTGYISLGNTSFPIDSDEVTIEIWATQISTKYFSHIYTFGPDVNYSAMEWTLGTMIDCDEVGFLNVPTENYGYCTHLAPYTLGQEFHIAAVFSKRMSGEWNASFYKQNTTTGETLKKVEYSSDVPATIDDFKELVLGHGFSKNYEDDANASYNEVRIWAIALTEQQLSDNAKLGPDKLPNDTPTGVKCTVTFDAAGGTAGWSKGEVVKGATVGMLPTATWEGYDFLGWFTAATGGTQVTAATVVTEDVTFYAHWTPIEYDISYLYLKGSENPNPTSYTIEDAITFTALSDVRGYRFAGWSPRGIEVGTTGDKTITANWTPIRYAITYVNTMGAANPNPTSYMIEDAVTFAALPDVEGWRFVGWSFAGISRGNTGDVTVSANWEAVTPSVIPDEEEPMDAGVANTYDGIIMDADGLPVGYISIKAAKASGKGEVRTSKVTATVQMVGEAKKVTVKGNVNVSEATFVQAAADGRVLDLMFTRNSIFGTFDGYEIEGVRNILASTAKGDKGSEAKQRADAIYNRLKGSYVMAYGDENGWSGLSVSVMSKGKVKVSGVLADGTKVSTSTQMIVGEDYSCIPVIYTKKNVSLAFSIYFSNSGDGSFVFGYYDAVISRVAVLDGERTFCLDGDLYGLFDEAGYELAEEFLPWEVSVAPKGTKWIVAGGAKAGQIKMDKDGEVYDKKESDNPSGLKLTLTAKTGLFKGSFKAYAIDAKGKLKSFSATVNGIVVDGLGYGTATIKKIGSVPVMIE